MEFRKVVQLAICIIGVYCANISSSEGSSWLNTTATPGSMPYQQHMAMMQQQMSNQQQGSMSYQQHITMMWQQMSNQQQMAQLAVVATTPKKPTVVATTSKKPAPLVPRRAINAIVVEKLPEQAAEMEVITARTEGGFPSCGCNIRVKSIPHKLPMPEWVYINSANEFLTDKSVPGDNQYYLYPKPTQALLYQDTTPTIEKIMKLKSAFSHARDQNIKKIADEQLLNQESKKQYLNLTFAIETLNILDIKYVNGAFFKPTFYILDIRSLNEELLPDEHGLWPYPKPRDSISTLCIKYYEQRFDEIRKHNLPIIEKLSSYTPEILSDYKMLLWALREQAIYSLLVAKQKRKMGDSGRRLCTY